MVVVDFDVVDGPPQPTPTDKKNAPRMNTASNFFTVEPSFREDIQKWMPGIPYLRVCIANQTLLRFETPPQPERNCSDPRPRWHGSKVENLAIRDSCPYPCLYPCPYPCRRAGSPAPYLCPWAASWVRSCREP